MALLKHVVLPCLCTLSAFSVVSILRNGEQATAMGFYKLHRTITQRDFTKYPLTIVERHLIDVLAIVHFILMVNGIVAIVWKDASYRGMAVLLYTLYCGTDAAFGYKNGYDPTHIVILTVICSISLIIHYNEPGIFAKDKNETTTASKSKKQK